MKQDRGNAMREIKSRLSLLEVVQRYVELRRAGNRWVAPCPFHSETKPSFSVNEEEGFFYCFGCQAAGDIFDFYGKINGLEFRETLEQLAEETGVVLGQVKHDPKAVVARDFKKAALAMYSLAGKHFQANLTSDAGATTRDYLASRKVSQEIQDQFTLGWSLSGWQGLTDSLRRAGFTPKQGIEAGLLAANERGGAYDRFRGRLIFPIKNLSGQIIAFGGRIIEEEDSAKYINSTDSILYKKGDNLYGLFQARRGISAKKSAIMTEGYMDVLTLHQFGYTNACGVLGTALTEEQIRRLSGFCSEIELIFDGDEPGRKAALRACEMILPKGLRCKVVLMPEKEDIDSLLQQQGSEAFEQLRSQAYEGLDFCIKTLAAHSAPKDIIVWVKKFIANVAQPELLTRYISRLTQAFELDEAEIRQAIALQPRSSNAALSGGTGTAFAHRAGAASKKDVLDREIMKFVIRYPNHIPILSDAGALLVLTQSWALSLWEKLESCKPHYDPDEVLRILDDKEKEFWGHHRVMAAPPPEHQQEELEDICSRIKELCLEKQGTACMQALRQGGAKGSDYDLELLKALNETLVQKRTLGSTDGEH